MAFFYSGARLNASQEALASIDKQTLAMRWIPAYNWITV